MADTSASKSVFTHGANTSPLHSLYSYTSGGLDVSPSSIHAFLHAGIASESGISAFVSSQSFAVSSKHAYIGPPQIISSISSFTEGAPVANNYITLANSNGSLIKQFRVIADGSYNDGMLSKAQTIERTVGGGLDVSVGEVYRSWNPTIRVRHTEPTSGYGTTDDLKTFYSYNSPNGTPSDKITFTDHHGDNFTVVISGEFAKQTLGVSIEGQEAWTLVALKLEEVV